MTNDDLSPRKLFAGKLRPADLAFVVLALLLAYLFHVGRFSQPWLTEPGDSDAQDIAAMVAGRAHPEHFVGDMLLGDERNFRYYTTVHFPLIRWTEKFVGHFGKAFLLQIGPHLFIYLLGFYFLGTVLTHSRLGGALLAFAAVPTMAVGFGTYWGIWNSPQPRYTFLALVPFLWALALLNREKPRRWPVLLFAAGLLMYVHPVSAPPVGFGLFLGFATQKPEAWSWRKFLLYLFFCGLVFLAAAGPFVVLYLNEHDHGQVPNAELVREGMALRFNKDFSEPIPPLWKFFKTYWVRLPIISLGLLAGLVLLLRGSPETRRRAAMVLGWFVGVLFAGAGLFLLDWKIARLTGGAPLEVDLIRTIRFLVGFGIVLALWGCAESWRLRGRAKIFAALASLLVAVVIFRLGTRSLDPRNHAYYRTPLQGIETLLGTEPKRDLHTEAIEAVARTTPPKAKILPFGVSASAIRFLARRPVTYSFKDGGSLAYANHEAFLRWYEVTRTLRAKESGEDPQALAQTLFDLAHQLDADYLIVDKNKGLGESVAALAGAASWENEGYLLVPIASPQVPAGL